MDRFSWTHREWLYCGTQAAQKSDSCSELNAQKCLQKQPQRAICMNICPRPAQGRPGRPEGALQELLLLDPMRPHPGVVRMIHGPNNTREKLECTLLALSWQFGLSSWHCWTIFLLWCVSIRYWSGSWEDYASPPKQRTTQKLFRNSSSFNPCFVSILVLLLIQWIAFIEWSSTIWHQGASP